MDDARHPADALTPAAGVGAAHPGSDAAISVVSEGALHAASPLWHPDEEALYWCDVAGRALHRLDPLSGARACWSFDTEVAGCAPAVGGGLLLALRSGIWHFDPQGGGRTHIAKPPYDPARERYGSGAADAHGRFWCGTLHDRGLAQAAIHRTSRGRTLREAEGLTAPDGLAWSPDARTFYVADSAARTVHAFDFDLGYGRRLLNRRRVFATFADAARDRGQPGGAAVDAEGCYWVAMLDGACVLRLAPDGRSVGEVRLPVRRPTGLCFGDADLRTLYVTSARDAADDASAYQPSQGCVLRLRVDVAGLQANFARCD